jgi:hypothetical protein
MTSIGKIRVLQTYPLKMNIVREIWMDQKLGNSAFNSSSLSHVPSPSV